ncbi:MAG: hypothetical protein AAF657_33280, partial [Acidobacteriota bacterium]
MIDPVKQRLLAVPAVAGWPEMVRLVDRMEAPTLPLWEFPVPACLAAGGETTEAEPAVATIFSLLLSIRLVDDLLDGDPGSQAEELGAGPTANLALAF